jgi:hypothetical protein
MDNGRYFLSFLEFFSFAHIGAFFKEGEKKRHAWGLGGVFFLLSIKNISLPSKEGIEGYKRIIRGVSCFFFFFHTLLLLPAFFFLFTHTQRYPNTSLPPVFPQFKQCKKKNLTRLFSHIP